MLNHKRKVGSFYKLFILFFILLFAVACSEDNNPVDSGMNSSGTSKISGRVDGNQGFSKISSVQSVEGAAVTVARVKADGSLETVSNASVQTDAEGKFTVETDVENEEHLVVVATKGSSEWKAVVSAEVKHNTTVYCPPMSDETTAEADVYAEAKAEGKTNTVFYSEIQTYVNSEIAAEMKSDANLKAQIVAALEAELSAKAAALTNSSFNASASQIQAIVDAKAKAQADFETALYNSSGGQSEYDSDFEAYQDAIVDAYIDAGLSAATCAKVQEIGAEATSNASLSLSSQAELALMKSYNRFKAHAMARAEKDMFEERGASDSEMNALISAEANLKASINAATSAQEMNNAFVEFHNKVVEQLKVNLNAYATTLAAIDSTINSSGGAKVVLESSLSAATSTSAVISAYATFFDSVKATVESSLSSATSAEADFAAEALIVANLN